MMDGFLITTMDSIPGYRIKKVLGVVSASTVRARHIGRDIIASLRNIVGGEIKEYTELMEQARAEVLRRLVEKAKGMGANAIVGLRFTTSMITRGAAEVMAYGTAVIVEPVE